MNFKYLILIMLFCNLSYSQVNDTFMVNPLPNVSPELTWLNVTEPFCIGENAIVTITSSTLANGTYNLSYSFSGSNTGSYVVNNMSFNSGTGTFSIPSSQLNLPGNTIITITAVTNSATGCSVNSIDSFIDDRFTVHSLPNLSGTNSVSVAQPLCIGDSGSVTFNASLLANGTYNLNYMLSGSNTGSFSASNVLIASGTGTFSIPSSQLTTSGNTTISITDVQVPNFCNNNSTVISSSFEISSRPELIAENTQKFCLAANPRVSNIISNFSNVNWYDSNTSTTPLDISTLLEDGAVYYGEAIDLTSGCTSEVREVVTIEIKSCEFLIPDGFSPNGDGINDIFNIVNGELYYPNYTIEVYDRYGSLLHTGKKWDGTYKGKLLPASVYFIIIYYNDNRTKNTQHRIYLNK